MRLSKEQFAERVAITRTHMVRNPGLSSRKLADLTGWSLEHSWKMLKHVTAERTKDLDASLAEEITIFEDTITELAKECWAIIQNKDVREVLKDGEIVAYQPAVTEQDRLRAIEVMTKNMKMLLDAKFDAGIFKKKLGEMEVKTFTAFVDLVKASASNDSAKQPATDQAGADSSSSPAISAGS